MSSFTKVVMKRRDGVIGLYVLIAIKFALRSWLLAFSFRLASQLTPDD